MSFIFCDNFVLSLVPSQLVSLSGPEIIFSHRFHNLLPRWRRLLEDQSARVLDPSHSHKSHAWLRRRFAQLNSHFAQSHSLRFPVRQCPGQDQGKLNAADVVNGISFDSVSENRHATTRVDANTTDIG